MKVPVQLKGESFATFCVNVLVSYQIQARFGKLERSSQISDRQCVGKRQGGEELCTVRTALQHLKKKSKLC